MFFFSCNNQSAIAKRFGESDSLVIHFTDPESGQITKAVEATTTAAIQKLSGFVGGKAVEVFKCGYNGNMQFYKGGKLNGDVSFQYQQEGCRHFLHMENGELTSTQMSHEAADFLKGLAEGRETY